jgi:hypothetical protein
MPTTIFECSASAETDMHFCKIDVDESEGHVLLRMNLARERPWTFCIEDLEKKAIGTLVLTRAEYQFAMTHHPNRDYDDKMKDPELSTVWEPLNELRKCWNLVWNRERSNHRRVR